MGWRARELDPEEKKIILEVDGVVDSTNLEQFFVFINSIFKRGFNRIVWRGPATSPAGGFR
jgi:hypothetical protein